MKNTITMIVVLGLLLIAGCVGQSKDVPPSPGELGTPIGQATGVYTGFSNGDQYIFLTDPVVLQTGSKVDLPVSIKDEFIWGDAYYLDKKTNNWKMFSLTGSKISGSNWIENEGRFILKINEQRFFDGDNFVISYTCRSVAGGFDCNNNQWLIKSFEVQVGGTPPPPPSPSIPTYQTEGDFNSNDEAYIQTIGDKLYKVKVGPLTGTTLPGSFTLEFNGNNTFDTFRGQYFGIQEPAIGNPPNPPFLTLIGGDGYAAIFEVSAGDNTDDVVHIMINTMFPPPDQLTCTGDVKEYIMGVPKELDFDGDGNVDSTVSLIGGDWTNQKPVFNIDGEQSGFMDLGTTFNSTTGVSITPEIIYDATFVDRGRMIVGACITKP